MSFEIKYLHPNVVKTATASLVVASKDLIVEVLRSIDTASSIGFSDLQFGGRCGITNVIA
jgi:hypothetical protein